MNVDKIIKEEVRILNEVSLDVNKLGYALADVESYGGDYTATNPKSSAAGKYQFLWNTWGKEIERVTGVSTKQEFLDSPQAQEKFFKYYVNTELKPQVATLKRDSTKSDAALAALVHFQGPAGAKRYLASGTETATEFNMPVEKYLDRVETSYYGSKQTSTKTGTTNNNKNIATSVGGTNVDIHTYLSGGASFTKKQLEILYKEWNTKPFETLKKQYKATAHVYPYKVEKDALIPTTDEKALERDYGILLNLTVKHPAAAGSSNNVDVEYMFFPDNSGFINFKGARKFFSYEIDQNNIELKFKNGDQRVLSVENGKIISTFTEFANTTQGIINQIQEVVSWVSMGLGFVFPGLADIIDILNAIAYYVQGKWLDGHLEMIAAIPIVGGVISRGLKLSLKGAQKAGKTLVNGSKLDPRAVSELLTIAKVRGYVTVDQLKMISSSIDPIITKLTKGTEFRKALDKYTPAEAAKYIDDIVDNLKILTNSGLASSSKTAADVIRAAGSTAQKRSLFSKLAKPQILLKAFSKSADKIDDAVAVAMKKVPDSKVTKVLESANRTFIKTLTTSPEILALLLKTIPPKKLTDTLATIATRKTKIPSEIALQNNKAFTGFVADLRKKSAKAQLDDLDTKKLIEFLRKNPSMIENLTKTMLDKQSPMRNLFNEYGKVFYDTQFATIYSKQMGSLNDLASKTVRRITRTLGARWWGELYDSVEDISVADVTGESPELAAAANAAGFSTDITLGGLVNDDPTGINTPEVHNNVILGWIKRQTMDRIFD